MHMAGLLRQVDDEELLRNMSTTAEGVIDAFSKFLADNSMK